MKRVIIALAGGGSGDGMFVDAASYRPHLFVRPAGRTIAAWQSLSPSEGKEFDVYECFDVEGQVRELPDLALIADAEDGPINADKSVAAYVGAYQAQYVGVTTKPHDSYAHRDGCNCGHDACLLRQTGTHAYFWSNGTYRTTTRRLVELGCPCGACRLGRYEQEARPPRHARFEHSFECLRSGGPRTCQPGEQCAAPVDEAAEGAAGCWAYRWDHEAARCWQRGPGWTDTYTGTQAEGAGCPRCWPASVPAHY